MLAPLKDACVQPFNSVSVDASNMDTMVDYDVTVTDLLHKVVKMDELVKYNKSYVQHKYHDHINDNMGTLAEHLLYASSASMTFPQVLHNMLQEVEEAENGDIVSWQPHGRAFRVHRKTEFVDTVLPQYFRQSSITSFHRQLNLYCFRRLASGEDKGAYYHELFLRGNPQLCQKLVRVCRKGNGTRPSNDGRSEPNFYTMMPANQATKSIGQQCQLRVADEHCPHHYPQNKIYLPGFCKTLSKYKPSSRPIIPSVKSASIIHATRSGNRANSSPPDAKLMIVRPWCLQTFFPLMCTLVTLLQ